MELSKYKRYFIWILFVLVLQSCSVTNEEEMINADGAGLGREMGYCQLRCNIELEKILKKELTIRNLEIEIAVLKEKFFDEFVGLLAERKRLNGEELSKCDKKYIQILESADTSRIGLINRKAAGFYNTHPVLADEIAGLNINFRYSDYLGLIKKPEISNHFIIFNKNDYEIKW